MPGEACGSIVTGQVPAAFFDREQNTGRAAPESIIKSSPFFSFLWLV